MDPRVREDDGNAGGIAFYPNPARAAPGEDPPGTVCTDQNKCVNSQYNEPDSITATGKVSTHAIARLRTVLICRPDWFATIVPATPEESTCVVDTGKPYMSAAPIVSIATTSAEAP